MVTKGQVIEVGKDRYLVINNKTIGKRDFCLVTQVIPHTEKRPMEFKIFEIRNKKGQIQVHLYERKKDFTHVLDTLLEIK